MSPARPALVAPTGACQRRIRLDHAHVEPLAATPEDVTVDQVAAHWGLARTGTFADHYRTTHGETPTRTPAGPDPVVTRLETLAGTLRTAATLDEALRHLARATMTLIPAAGLVVVARSAAAVHSAGDLDLVRDHGAVLSVDTGTFTVYSRPAAGFSDADRAMARLLAAHCALVVAHDAAVRAADVHRAQLVRAIDSRDLIGQAKGILMHKECITAEEAFEVLRRTSQDHNIKLVDLARTLTQRHGELDRPR